MISASIAFLWHMHQPFYLDRITGEMSMPWVRLHAIKSYYDMVSILEDIPVKATFNMVPSLITQLLAYQSGRARDIFYEYSLIPADELTPEQKKFVLRSFFQANWENMITPNKRYWQLMGERGLHVPPDSIDDSVAAKFNTAAYRDIQVWFNLSWFGYRARKRYPALNELMRKGAYFNEDDKREVLSTQMQIIREILPSYRRAQERGQVELTTSPFYHPILPLLCDSEFARRAMPGVRLPERFSHPEDARAQIGKAVAFHKEVFNQAPRGMWPSEGSVCPEIIPLVREAGIEWMATDEGILAQTLKSDNIYQDLYLPYRARFAGAEVNMIFRDRGLSDLIAFGYSRNNPEEASEDLLFRLREIGREHWRADGQPIVPIILDGENSWEYYPCGGEEFLSRVYEKLSNDESLEAVTVSEYLDRNRAGRYLDNLHSGSWIGHNFDIWIGETEENKAWDYVNRTRRFLERFEAEPQKQGLDSAWESLYAAEGSDWFWWYGPDFTTDNDAEFDRLFRMHLQNVYKFIKAEPPHYLFNPLLLKKKPRIGRPPVSLIKPKINGRVTDFFEWQGAGLYECGRGDMAIALGCRYITHVYYGFDMDNLYLRFDLDTTGIRPEDSAVRLQVYLSAGRLHRLTMPLYLDFAEKKQFMLERSEGGTEFEQKGSYETIAWSKVLELSVPFADLDYSPGQEIEFFVSLKNDRIEIMRFPRASMLSFTVPGESFESEMWVV